MKTKVFFDIECYTNYFLVCFKSEKACKYYELHENSTLDVKSIKQILNSYCLVGFNSNNYDLPMLAHALDSKSTNLSLKRLSDTIVQSKDRGAVWDILKELNVKINDSWDHIDLFNVAPKIDSEYKVGLKVYGARLNTKLLQDLPIHHDAIIEQEQHKLLRKYCLNDVHITKELYESIKELIELRVIIGEENKIDLRSSSDAQIAEKLIRKNFNINKITNEISTEEFKYTPPKHIKFKDLTLLGWLTTITDCKFKSDEKGKILKSNDVDTKFTIKKVQYSVGIGGLHSVNKSESYIAKESEYILDVDFSSYYPAIILTNKYYPENLGEDFLKFYEDIFNKRILAKNNNDKIGSEVYKIVLNGIFGKTNNRWSCLYDPKMFLNITLTGQLITLMLIEKLNIMNCDVISANTDGVTFKGLKKNIDSDKLSIEEWAKSIGIYLDMVNYKAIYCESVNTYVAIKDNGDVKSKGVYADQSLKKNPVVPICVEAALNKLRFNKPIRRTILENRNNIDKFVVVRKVTSGASWKGNYLGKIVRWYYGLNGEYIYNKKGDKVATSDGATPLMNLGDFNTPININVYVEKTQEMLKNLGVNL